MAIAALAAADVAVAVAPPPAAPPAPPRSPTAGSAIPGAAQQPDPLRGRVLLGTDSIPVPGAEVALHRIAGESGGVLDRDTTGADGGFRLRGGAAADSGGLYLAATRYREVLYFGGAYRGGEEPPSPYRILVFETTPLGSPDSLPVSTRHLILRPAEDGRWSVTDLVEVRNEGDRTLVAPSGRREVWSVPLPDGAGDAAVAEAGVSANEVTVSGGRVRVASTVPPGAQRVAMEYTLPEGEAVTLQTEHPVRRLELLVRGEGTEVASGVLAAAGPVRFRGEVFGRYSAADLAPGARVTFTAGAGGRGPLPWLFVALGAALLAAAALVRSRQGGTGTAAEEGRTSLMVAALAAGAASCGAGGALEGPAATADTLRVPDDSGDTLVLAQPADRVVSLIPAATEILFAVGAGDRVVGRTRYGTHPEAARGVPSVGEGMRPSAEAVLSRRPDAVVVYAGRGNRGSIRRFEQLGIPVLAVAHNTIPELIANIRRLGLLTGRESAADSLARSIRERLARVAEVVRGQRPVSVYYDVWSDPPRTIGAGSYLDSLIALAGGRNVFGDQSGPSPRVGLESVAERAPDVILFPRGAGSEERAPPADRPGWESVGAVRRGAVRRVDGELLHRLGPRLGEAAAHLAATLHPSLSDSLRGRGLLPAPVRPDSSPSGAASGPARATTWGAPSSGPGPGWETIRTGHR